MKKEPVAIPLAMDLAIQRMLVESNSDIIAEVMGRFAKREQQMELRIAFGVNEDWHNTHRIRGLYDRGCGCLYCQTVHKYVISKVQAHRLQRRIDSCDYMLRPYDSPDDFKNLRMMNKEWRRLREESHEIRDLLGIKK